MTLVSLVPAGVLVATFVLKPAQPADLTIDVSALTSMPSREYRAMIREAGAIWRPYGVSLTWVAAPGGASLPENDRLLTVVDAGPVIIDRLRVATPRLGAVVFEDGHILAEQRVTMAVGEVERLVDEAPWVSGRVGDCPPAFREELVGRALGRVLAHEIGHYMLAWRTHTPKGLMRSDFRNDLLVDPDRRSFQIAAVLLPRLYARLAQLRASTDMLARSE